MIANREVLQAAESLPSAPPSERDLEIFAAVHVDCRRQVDVAAEFGISQSRVSQICRDVALWRLGAGVNADLEGRDRKQVEAWLDAQRLEWLYEHTLENYRRSCLPKRRERKGSNQHGEWHAETIDHPAGNLQCLRLASRLLELRWKMDEKCPQPSPHALAHCDETIFINRLISMRHWAEVRGEVQPGEEPAGRLVKRLLNELLGRGGKQAASAEWDSTKAPTSGRGDGRPTSPACAAGGDGNSTLTNGQGFEHVMPAKDGGPLEVGAAGPAGAHHAERDGYGAHTAHIISAAAPPYERAGDADGVAVSGCPEATWDEARTRAEAGPQEREEEEKRAAHISGEGVAAGDQRRQGARDQRPGAGGSGRLDLADEEQLALAELRRTFSVEIGPSMANHSVPNLLAEGQANLVLQGYTREQRQALLGWQRVMDLKKQEQGAR